MQSTRKILFTRLEKLKETFDRLQVCTNKESLWKSTNLPIGYTIIIIVEKKNRTLQICFDPKPLNDGIERE